MKILVKLHAHIFHLPTLVFLILNSFFERSDGFNIFLGKILKHYLLKFDGIMGKFCQKITNDERFPCVVVSLKPCFFLLS